MAEIHVPETLELGLQVGQLLGRTVRVTEVEGRNKFDDSCHVAYYVTREDELAGFCVVDFPLSGYLGGALAMIPAGTIEEFIEGGALDEDLLEAYYEVANIMAALLCADGAPHVRLIGIDDAGKDFERLVLTTIADPCVRLDIQVEVEDYGTGLMTLLTTRQHPAE